VGQTSNVALAALGPNTAIFNFVFQVLLCARSPALALVLALTMTLTLQPRHFSICRPSHIAVQCPPRAAALP